jgi:hypothetical protein
MSPEEQKEYEQFVEKLPSGWRSFLTLLLWVVIVAAVCLCGRACATTIGLSWTANPPEQNVIGYRVYRVSPEPRTLLVDTTATSATVAVNDGDRLVLTAYSATGESADSSQIIVRLTPQEPYKKITLQISSDLQTWTDWQTNDIAASEGTFFRLKIESNQ